MISPHDQNIYSEEIADGKSCRGSADKIFHEMKHTEPLCEDISGIF